MIIKISMGEITDSKFLNTKNQGRDYYKRPNSLSAIFCLVPIDYVYVQTFGPIPFLDLIEDSDKFSKSLGL
jgi:hypothetical protein